MERGIDACQVIELLARVVAAQEALEIGAKDETMAILRDLEADLAELKRIADRSERHPQP